MGVFRLYYFMPKVLSKSVSLGFGGEKTSI